MCGFFGFIGASSLCSLDESVLNHRGPDSFGRIDGYTDNLHYTFAHWRLSIHDLSSAGQQPFENERYIFIFNGEIYNFLELRSSLELSGDSFISNTDTEVLFRGLIRFGPEFLHECNGMWSYVLFDKETGELSFGRDRFGKKPFFYFLDDKGGLFFASEMKALYPYCSSLSLRGDISSKFKTVFDYEATSRSVFRDLCKLRPGHVGKFQFGGSLTQSRWWNTLDHLVDVPLRYEDQVKEFRRLFLDSVRLRMRSDVPVGTALSGGLDSSATFSAMSYLRKEKSVSHASKLVAFSASYPGSSLDEIHWARLVTKNLDVDHKIVTVTPDSNDWDLSRSFYQVEDPYITFPIPMLLTYEACKKSGITVSVDGHGADELFSGYGDIFLSQLFCSYHRFFEIEDIKLGLNSGEHVRCKRSILGYVLGQSLLLMRYFARSLRTILWRDESRLHPDINHPKYREMTLFSRRLYTIFHYSVLPTLLRNYDRYSMASGVEVRMPFLDHRLVCYCFSLPDTSKLGGGYTKRIMRDALKGIVPQEVLDRRDKIGWNAPLHEWFKGPVGSEISKILLESDELFSRKVWNKFQELDSPSFHDGQRVWSKIQPAIWRAFLKRWK